MLHIDTNTRKRDEGTDIAAALRRTHDSVFTVKAAPGFPLQTQLHAPELY